MVLLRADRAALMQLRDNKPGLNAAGLWVFPGGHCEDEESFEAAARREFAEETGYVCAELRWVTTFSCPSDDGTVTFEIGFFVGRYDGIQSVHCYEGQAMEFVAREAVVGLPMPGYVLRVWDLAIATLARG